MLISNAALRWGAAFGVVVHRNRLSTTEKVSWRVRLEGSCFAVV